MLRRVNPEGVSTAQIRRDLKKTLYEPKRFLTAREEMGGRSHEKIHSLLSALRGGWRGGARFASVWSFRAHYESRKWRLQSVLLAVRSQSVPGGLPMKSFILLLLDIQSAILEDLLELRAYFVRERD